MPPFPVKRFALLTAAALVFSIVVGFGIAVGAAALRPSGGTFYGQIIAPPLAAANFTLPSTRGGDTSLSDFRGKYVLLFFGFTNCPDVCPVTLVKLAQTKQRLGPLGDQVQIALVTVDPERDTVDQLRRYLAQYDPNAVGFTGTPEQIAVVLQQYGIVAERVPIDGALGYTYNHTASTLVIDRQGQVRALLSPEMSSEEMASDLRFLLTRS
ncbi:MAG: SCO family protein [Dehalococcoidia bacterium]|nr:SCO family protein [Dehalococcoidia bacterium]